MSECSLSMMLCPSPMAARCQSARREHPVLLVILANSGLRLIVGGASFFLTESQPITQSPPPGQVFISFVICFPQRISFCSSLPVRPFGSVLPSVSSCPPSLCTPAPSGCLSFSHLPVACFCPMYTLALCSTVSIPSYCHFQSFQSAF